MYIYTFYTLKVYIKYTRWDYDLLYIFINVCYKLSSLHMIWHRFYMCAILYNGKVFTEICELDDGAVEGDVGRSCWKIFFDR